MNYFVTFLLHELSEKYEEKDISDKRYWDDGLAVFKNKGGPQSIQAIFLK